MSLTYAHILRPVSVALALVVGLSASSGAAPAKARGKGAAKSAKPVKPARFSLSSAEIPDGAVAVETATGDVRVTARPGAAEAPVRVGQFLAEGALVRTGSNGRVFLRFSSTDVVRLSPRTEIRITALHSTARPSRPMTVVSMIVGRARAMLKRARPSPVPDFAFVAGGSICAVKGTDFEENVAQESNGTVTVTLRVDSGSVSMLNAVAAMPGNAVLSAADVSAALGRGLGAVNVGAGHGTKSEGGGAIAPPAPVPPRTALEIVAVTPGTRIQVTVNGVTSELAAGDEVPPGAAVRVSGGEAVLSSGGQAVAAGDGASFTYTAAVTPGSGGTSEVQVVIVVADNSRGGVGVESGGGIANLNPGDGSVSSGTTRPAVTTAPTARGTADAAGAPATDTPAGDDPMPDLPTLNSDGAAAPPATEDAPPPPPPDTVNQDVPTVSPAAP